MGRCFALSLPSPARRCSALSAAARAVRPKTPSSSEAVAVLESAGEASRARQVPSRSSARLQRGGVVGDDPSVAHSRGNTVLCGRAAERLCVVFPHPCSSASRSSPGTAPPPARHDADQNHLLFALSEKIARPAQGWLLSTDREIAGFQENARHTVWPTRWGLASLPQGTGQSARCLLPVGRHRQKAKNHLT